jgi:AcrR family transcriptional regulator
MAKSADPSRARLLAAGRKLFAEFGYENTQTAALARDAGTSESQLVRYFGGKAGLLDAIFEAAWERLNVRIHDLLTDAPDARRAVLAILTTVLSAFKKDAALAVLFLLEGRRIRAGSHDVRMSAGFIEFSGTVRRLILRGQKDGSFSPDLDSDAMAVALMGAVEGMVRERVLARRAGAARVVPDAQIQRIFTAMLDGFGPKKAMRRSGRAATTV